jgi:hypothetical protein
MKRPLAVAALILGSLILPACGLTGDLKRPDPLWGDPQDVEAELPEGRQLVPADPAAPRGG